MNGQQPAENPVISAFGKAVGFVLAIFTTMPIYHFSYDGFYHYALAYSHWDYRWFWELVYIVSIFAVITVSGWFVLAFVIGTIKAIFRFFGFLFIMIWR